MKGKQEFSEKELKEIEASKLSEAQGTQRELRELSDNYISLKKDIVTMNENQMERKKAISEMKNKPEGIKSRLGETED